MVSDYKDVPLELIPHEIDGAVIPQRSKDGYVNATAMCKAAGKLIADYLRLDATKEFRAELEGSMGFPIDPLVVTITGGPNAGRGTWVHPDMAINLAQWCSAKFAVRVSQWVREWMTTGQAPIPAIDLSDRLAVLRLLQETTQEAIVAEEGRRIAVAEVKELTEEIATQSVEKEELQQQLNLITAKVDVGERCVVHGDAPH